MSNKTQHPQGYTEVLSAGINSALEDARCTFIVEVKTSLLWDQLCLPAKSKTSEVPA